MDLTKVLSTFNWLKAIWLATGSDAHNLFLVLPEVKTFCRKQLASDRHLKVFIRYFSVSIKIKCGKDTIKSLLVDFDPPEVKKILELPFANRTCLLHV